MIDYSSIIDKKNAYTKQELLEISTETNAPLGLFHYLRGNKKRVDQTYNAMIVNTCTFASLASLFSNLNFIGQNFLGFIYIKNSIELFIDHVKELDIKEQNSITMDFGGITIFDNILEMQRFYGEVDEETRKKQIAIEIHALINYFYPKILNLLKNPLEVKKIYLDTVDSFFENITPKDIIH
jgi:hypothetical protein